MDGREKLRLSLPVREALGLVEGQETLIEITVRVIEKIDGLQEA